MGNIGSALIGAGASLLGNMFGFGSNQSANRTNLKIAQMNNDWNAKMMERQMQYNTEMWNRENEYNSAKNQVARLREAGLNPYLALGNAGQAGSVGSVTPPQAQSVSVSPYSWNFDKVADVAQQFVQNDMHKALNDEQVSALQIDNQTRAIKNLAELNRLQEETSNTRLRNQYQEISNRWADGLQYAEYHKKMTEVKSIKEDVRNKTFQGLLMSKELSTFDMRFKAELAQTISTALLNKASALTHGTVQRLNNANLKRIHEEVSNMVADRLLTEAKTSGQKISNDIAQRSATAIVEKAITDGYLGSSPAGVISSLLRKTVERLGGDKRLYYNH